jgi:hypothetical protein
VSVSGEATAPPLEERLRNYVMVRKATVAESERVSRAIHEKFPEGAETSELDAAVRAQKHIFGELDRLLAGEEVVKVTGGKRD